MVKALIIAMLLWGAFVVRPGLQFCEAQQDYRETIVKAWANNISFSVSPPYNYKTSWIAYVYEDAKNAQKALDVSDTIDSKCKFDVWVPRTLGR